MEIEQKQLYLEPVSPTGQCLSNDILSVSIIAVLEFEAPIDDSQLVTVVKDVILPINPRFSSIMVGEKNGMKRWKRVDVLPQDLVNIPTFPEGMSSKFYDEYFDDYLSKIAIEQLPQNKPLWEIHIIKYPTSHAAYTLIFKFQHSIGDGYSLMAALLSCFQRADNPSLPLTFPHVQLRINKESKNIIMCRKVPNIFSSVYNTVSDFCSGIIKSSLVKDAKSPIRSGHAGVENLPRTTTTITFSLDHIKQIKGKLGATINDVIAGIIFLGVRLYMEKEKQGSGNARSTSLVLLNTRMFRGYKSVQEMVKPDAEFPWGNRITFLSVSIPKLTDPKAPIDPLQFVRKARNIIKKKRFSFAVYLTARYLQLLRKFRGPEAVSRYSHSTMKNSSMGISNVVGPVEKVALANCPVKGMYFAAAGVPHSIVVGVLSYMGELRVAMFVEKDFINPEMLNSHIQNAFDMILKAASEVPPTAN